MPSPRPTSSATTAMRPTSPLSPRFEASRYDSIQQRQQPYQPRSPTGSKTQRRQYGNNLTRPGLPRFHPANYPSAHSSFANTPTSGPNSPVLQQRFPSDSKQFYAYQRDCLARPTSSQLNEKPTSPRLQPLGSPGPVTPLELAAADGYISLVKPTSRPTGVDPEDLSKKLSSGSRPRDSLPHSTSTDSRSH